VARVGSQSEFCIVCFASMGPRWPSPLLLTIGGSNNPPGS
jgi:hypothetical protein